MIYSFEETLSIFLRIYGYLQINAAKKMPCSVKMEKPRHKTVVFSFIEKLPPDSGVDFIWEFLLFQFYFYSTQVHERRPLPGWFIGKEAWKRWNEYDEGSHYHVHEWARERGLKNPVKSREFINVTEDSLRKERLRMSRISGPNFCGMKYGDAPYDPKDEMCITCPFKNDCRVIYGEQDEQGKNLFQRLGQPAMEIIPTGRINVIQKTHIENYDE